METDFAKLRSLMMAHFSLGDWSLHGPNHWRNVELNGLQLCRMNSADRTVVRLFAIFHDAERLNEGHDPDHGRRAARLIQSLHGVEFQVAEFQLDLLLDACRFHNDGLTSENLTIGTCWDADRMDLPRVGITPDARKMSTKHGKEFAVGGRATWSKSDQADGDQI